MALWPAPIGQAGDSEPLDRIITPGIVWSRCSVRRKTDRPATAAQLVNPKCIWHHSGYFNYNDRKHA